MEGSKGAWTRLHHCGTGSPPGAAQSSLGGKGRDTTSSILESVAANQVKKEELGCFVSGGGVTKSSNLPVLNCTVLVSQA